tara:strand:+ start:115 stop:432 length:318 start_codon:yes stop_codon:yes gene_type:complete
MTASVVPTSKDQELYSLGLVESASVNSFADFIPSEFNESAVEKDNEANDFKNTFICHLIFYAFFCVSLVMYIFIDLGLGSFFKNKIVQLIGLVKSSFFNERPAFA